VLVFGSRGNDECVSFQVFSYDIALTLVCGTLYSRAFDETKALAHLCKRESMLVDDSTLNSAATLSAMEINRSDMKVKIKNSFLDFGNSSDEDSPAERCRGNKHRSLSDTELDYSTADGHSKGFMGRIEQNVHLAYCGPRNLGRTESASTATTATMYNRDSHSCSDDSLDCGAEASNLKCWEDRSRADNEQLPVQSMDNSCMAVQGWMPVPVPVLVNWCPVACGWQPNLQMLGMGIPYTDDFLPSQHQHLPPSRGRHVRTSHEQRRLLSRAKQLNRQARSIMAAKAEQWQLTVRAASPAKAKADNRARCKPSTAPRRQLEHWQHDATSLEAAPQAHDVLLADVSLSEWPELGASEKRKDIDHQPLWPKTWSAIASEEIVASATASLAEHGGADADWINYMLEPSHSASLDSDWSAYVNEAPSPASRRSMPAPPTCLPPSVPSSAPVPRRADLAQLPSAPTKPPPPVPKSPAEIMPFEGRLEHERKPYTEDGGGNTGCISLQTSTKVKNKRNNAEEPQRRDVVPKGRQQKSAAQASSSPAVSSVREFTLPAIASTSRPSNDIEPAIGARKQIVQPKKKQEQKQQPQGQAVHKTASSALATFHSDEVKCAVTSWQKCRVRFATFFVVAPGVPFIQKKGGIAAIRARAVENGVTNAARTTWHQVVVMKAVCLVILSVVSVFCQRGNLPLLDDPIASRVLQRESHYAWSTAPIPFDSKATHETKQLMLQAEVTLDREITRAQQIAKELSTRAQKNSDPQTQRRKQERIAEKKWQRESEQRHRAWQQHQESAAESFKAWQQHQDFKKSIDSMRTQTRPLDGRG